jgi:hypothetical protein
MLNTAIVRDCLRLPLVRRFLACLSAEGGLLCVALLDAFGESFDRSWVEALLAEVFASDVDVGLLAGAGEGDIGALTVCLPARGCRKSGQAAISYSWISPPRTSRRLTDGGSLPTAWRRRVGAGASISSARCGR